MPRKQIIVTDLTRMGDFDVCLAGVEISNVQSCVRPLLSSGPGRQTLHPDENWLRSAIGGPIGLFSVVNVEEFGNRPDPPHTEDWGVSGRPPRVEQAIDVPERQALLGSLQQPSDRRALWRANHLELLGRWQAVRWMGRAGDRKRLVGDASRGTRASPCIPEFQSTDQIPSLLPRRSWNA